MTVRTAEVAVFAGVRGPAQTFSYLVPDGLDLLPGHLVRVGLGKRAVPGVVISCGAAAGRELRRSTRSVSVRYSTETMALAGWTTSDTLRLTDAVRAMVPRARAFPRAVAAPCAARGERTEGP